MCFSGQSIPLQALIDFGAETNFLETEVAQQARVSVVPLSPSVPVCALSGRNLANISHQTGPLSLALSCNHRESISLHLISSPSALIVLSYL